MEREDILFSLCTHLDLTTLQVISTVSSSLLLTLKLLNKQQHFWKVRAEVAVGSSLPSNLDCSWKEAYYALYSNNPTCSLLAIKLQHRYLNLELNIESLIRASSDCKLDVVEYILENTIISVLDSGDIDDIMHRCKENKSLQAKVLATLGDPRMDLGYGISNLAHHMVRMLIQGYAAFPEKDDNYLFKLACQEGYVDLARYLLGYRRSTMVRTNELGNTRVNVVKADPRAGDNYAMKAAVRRGHTEIVKLLQSWDEEN